jgi:hypothetical protein
MQQIGAETKWLKAELAEIKQREKYSVKVVEPSREFLAKSREA